MRPADRAFALVVVLALASSAILVALLATLLPRVDHLLTNGPTDVADVVAAVLLVLAMCGIVLGVGSLLRQLAGTAKLIRALVARTVPVPARVRSAARGLGLDGRIDVVDDERPFSFCYWFLRPRICISTAVVRRLDHDELRAVLLHERYHLRQRDPLRLVVALSFAAGLYVVPVVDELVGFYALQKEIAAVEEAARAAGGVRALARALYKLLPEADEVSLGLLLPVSSLSVTEARIERLVVGREASLRLAPLSLALSAGALLGASVLVAVGVGTSMTFESLPPLLAVP
ncbi:MAG: M56 family metallopeptidase, partial [Chloroflexota bacterium]